MVATPVKLTLIEVTEIDRSEADQPSILTLEEFLVNPPEHMEWVDGEVIEKTGMTVQHSLVQGKLVQLLRNNLDALGQGGQALPEAPCRTLKQIRRPDIAYIPAELMMQIKGETVSPQVFPWVAEVASPDDSAEMLFSKALEYIEAGCQEVWLLFPKAQLIMIKVGEQLWRLFNLGETVESAIALSGFRVLVDDLLL
jgi:Uma2 family endonuclease